MFSCENSAESVQQLDFSSAVFGFSTAVVEFSQTSGIGIVSFEVSAMGRRSGIGGFVVVLAEGKVKALCHELACLLGFAAKTVEGPLLRGRKALFQRDDFVESLDAMQGQRFAERFG